MSKIAYKTGKTTIVKTVADTKPPITTVAKGLCTSAPALVDTAIGKNPKAAAAAVKTTGLSRSFVPFKMRSLTSSIPFSFNDFKCSISTIPFKTAIPNSAINPTPAEILNGKPLIKSKNTPPIAANGIAEKIINASLILLNAKCNKIKISKSAIGTANLSRAFALFKFSN